jgi:TolB-like protein
MQRAGVSKPRRNVPKSSSPRPPEHAVETEYFEFGPFTLDATRGVLNRDGAAVELGHRAVLLLCALLRAEGQALTKAELIEAAWPGLVVEESNLSVQVTALRRALGTNPAGGQWIATIARVGYRFDGPAAKGSAAPAQQNLLASSQGDPPSIVVLPLANVGASTEQEYLVDGISEDIIMALTRFRWFRVIGRNSSFAFKGRAMPSQDVAQALGVRYVLEGSVRQRAHQFRITTQLIDAATANQIWSERFDLAFDDLAGAQDTIAQRVAGAIEPELLRSESALAAVRNPGGLVSAWDLVHRGAWHFHQIQRAGHEQARALFRQACAVDPDFAPAHLWLARVSAGRVAYGWTDDEAADLREGIDAAFKAIHRDEKNAYTHYALAIVSVYAGEFEQAIRAAERAVELNPSFALGHLVLGMARVFSGDAKAAIAPLEHGLQINPADPQNFVWFSTLACALLFAGRPRAAIDSAERALKVRPDWRPAAEMAVCCLAGLGDADRYLVRLKSLARLQPAVVGDALAPLRHHNPHWAAALTSALSGAAEPLHSLVPRSG